MADKEYIILRQENPIGLPRGGTGIGGPGAGPLDLERDTGALELEQTRLSKAEHEDLRRDPRTRVMAEPMPMRLIEPLDATDVEVSDTATATWGINAINAPDSNFTGEGITVAVLDTGIDPTHPAFAGIDLIQKNFTTEGENDRNGHGTHCAGTIFGQDVDGQRIGVARNIRRALIGKVLGQGGGSSASIAKAIQWALDGGAHVISMSLGIDFPGFVNRLVTEGGFKIEPATSMALEAYRANVNLFNELAGFIQAHGAFGEGTIVIGASGNESHRPDFEIAVAPPAAGTGILAVGALQEGASGFEVANFSNTEVDLSGPGVGIRSAAVGGGLTSKSGTSMATPHVAGAAVLWAQKQLQQTGRLKADTLTAQLVASGDASGLAPDVEANDVGTGMVQTPIN